MNDLFEGVTSWIAETYDGLCSEIGAGIQEKDASRVMVNALLVVGFTGGMSAVLGNRWTGGLRVEFEARNYAKRKDLRHKNTRLDFEFSPSFLTPIPRLRLRQSTKMLMKYTRT